MQGGRGRPIAPSCRVSERASLFRALCRFKEQMAFIHAAAESYLPRATFPKTGFPINGLLGNWASGVRHSRKFASGLAHWQHSCGGENDSLVRRRRGERCQKKRIRRSFGGGSKRTTSATCRPKRTSWLPAS